MKSTAYFTQTILTYLEQRASVDALFAQAFAKENRNIDDCCTYILNEVQKSGCNGFADDEIYGMAMDYYFSEKDIETGKSVNCRMVVNHVVELTAEEKEQAHKDAMQKAHNDAYNKMMQPRKRVASKQTANTDSQLTLF